MRGFELENDDAKTLSTNNMAKIKRDEVTKLVVSLAVLTILIIMLSGGGQNILDRWWYRGYSARCEGRPKRFDGFGIRLPAGYTVHGLDVSHFVCSVDWLDVRRATYNGVSVKFAITRATSGTNSVDMEFDANWAGIKKVGLIRGAYHYLKPAQSAISQAAKYLSKAMPERGDLPPILDIEETNNLNDKQMRSAIAQWLHYVERNTKMRPIIYVNRSYFEQYIRGYFDDYPVWIAAYGVGEEKLPEGVIWQFWQHTDKARINGASEWVDLNVFNGNLQQLRGFCKK